MKILQERLSNSVEAGRSWEVQALSDSHLVDESMTIIEDAINFIRFGVGFIMYICSRLLSFVSFTIHNQLAKLSRVDIRQGMNKRLLIIIC